MKLSEAKALVQDIKDQAETAYDWTLTKDQLEEIIGTYDEYKTTESQIDAIEMAVGEVYAAIREKAARNLLLAMIHEENASDKNMNKSAC